MTLTEPPRWVKVLPRDATKGVDIQLPVVGQVVPTAGRSWGSEIPAIFVLDEAGTEYLVFDHEWTTP